MLRFIDLRGQGTGKRFSFYNTVSSDFVRGDSGQGWNLKKDLEDDGSLDPDIKERMIALLPMWVSWSDEEDDHQAIADGEVPSTVSHTYEEIRSEMDRYGNSPHDKLWPLLNLITDVNTDLYHGGVGIEPVSALYKELDRLSGDLLGPNTLTPFDTRVLAFFSVIQHIGTEDISTYNKSVLQLLATTDEQMNAATEKLLKLGLIGPGGNTKQH